MLLRNGEETTPFTDCKLGPVSVILTRFTVIRGSFPYIEPDEYQNIIMIHEACNTPTKELFLRMFNW